MSGTSLELAVPGGMATGVALTIASLLALGLACWEVRGLGRLRCAILLTLRGLAMLLVLGIACQPQLIQQIEERREGALALLVDVSRSLHLPRGPANRAAGDGAGDRSRIGGATRAHAVRALLARWLGEGSDNVAVYTFGDELRAGRLDELAADFVADADDTQLVASLKALLEQEGGDGLGAVVVVSDGADRSGLDPERIRDQGVRVHTVGIGRGALRDQAVLSVEADPVSFLRRRGRVRVVVRSSGGRAGPVVVTLRRGQQVEREAAVEVPADGQATVEIPFLPTRLGRAVYTVSIPVSESDAVPSNNRRAFVTRVTRDKLRVLLVAGQPSWDQRFLRAFLKGDPANDLISFFILRNTADLTMASPDELALIPFPTDELFNEHLGSFDLVVFQNFEYGPYQMARYLPRIRDYVLRGGSFAMIGGPLSFGSGAYAATAVAEVLPVEVPSAQVPDDQRVASGRFKPRIVRGMEHHPLLALRPHPAANATAWSRLSPLVGVNIVTRVRAGSSVLLEHPRLSMPGSPQRLPVLVLGRAGEGRTLALTTDTTWRWGMTTGGRTGDPSAYEAFWDRAVRWLARDPSLEPARITTHRERYGLGASVRIRGVVSDERYVPYAERTIAVRLLGAESGEVSRIDVKADRAGAFETVLDGPGRAGVYRVEARLPDSDQRLAQEWFLVEAGGDELADVRTNHPLLRALSASTRGRFYRAEQAPALSAFDTTQVRQLGVHTEAPFATVWAVSLLMLLLGAEWFCRRRWGRR